MKLALIAVCCIVGVAHADRDHDRAQRADTLFKKGKKLLSERKYPEACTAFEESDRLDPGIGAKLNVARCYQEWGKLATAWRWYREAEQMASDARDERAARIHTVLEELEPSVPRLTVKAPAGADTTAVIVELDGIALEAGALGVARRVDPGPHQVDTVIAGARRSRTVPLERGGNAEVILDLPVRPGAPPPPPPRTGPVVAEPSDPGRTRRYAAYGLTGGGAFAVVIAGIVTLRARSDYQHALSGYCQGAKDMCDQTGLDRTHSARHHANIATVFAIGGLAAVGAGAYLYFTLPGVPSRTEHALYLAPQLGSDGGALVVGGAF